MWNEEEEAGERKWLRLLQLLHFCVKLFEVYFGFAMKQEQQKISWYSSNK